jgi:integrase
MDTQEVALATYKGWRHLKPTTQDRYAKALTKVLQYLVPPEWRLPKETAYLLRRMARRRKAVVAVKRAFAVSFAGVQALLQANISEEIKVYAVLLFVSASRFDDLWRETTTIERQEKCLKLHIPISKSDPDGEGLTKYLQLDQYWSDKVLAYQRVPYRTFLKTIQVVNPRLTAHSFRRGACTKLASAGYANKQIARLTGHKSSETNDERSIRVYIDPSPNQPIGRLQRQMSGILSKGFYALDIDGKGRKAGGHSQRVNQAV